MPLFRRESPDSNNTTIRSPKASAAVDEILAHLDEELWRARRYERPLSVATATPVLLKGERLGDKLTASVLEAARTALRRTDGVRMVEGPLLIAVLPETGELEAQSAAFRLKTELTLPGLASRQVKWHTAAVTLTTETNAAELLEAALATLAEAA